MLRLDICDTGRELAGYIIASSCKSRDHKEYFRNFYLNPSSSLGGVMKFVYGLVSNLVNPFAVHFVDKSLVSINITNHMKEL